jgi:hypothetical protein
MTIRRQGRQRLVVDEGGRIDVVLSGPGQLLLAGKAAAVFFAVGRIVASARSVHAGERNAAIFGRADRQGHAHGANDEAQRGGRQQAAT